MARVAALARCCWEGEQAPGFQNSVQMRRVPSDGSHCAQLRQPGSTIMVHGANVPQLTKVQVDVKKWRHLFITLLLSLSESAKTSVSTNRQ